VEELRLISEDPGQAPSLATALAQVKAATGFDPARWLGSHGLLENGQSPNA
jgi:hypothetical protein